MKNQKLAENVCTPTTKDAEHDEPSGTISARGRRRWSRGQDDATPARRGGRRTRRAARALSRAARRVVAENIFARGTASQEISRGADELVCELSRRYILLYERSDFPRRPSRVLASASRGRSVGRRFVACSSTRSSSKAGLADDGTCVLIDEVLTPDSSRYWLAHSYEAGVARRRPGAREHRQGIPRLWYRERCDPYNALVVRGNRSPWTAAPDELVCELSRRYITASNRARQSLHGRDSVDFQAASTHTRLAVDRPAVLAARLSAFISVRLLSDRITLPSNKVPG